jgi:hypothetical protein
MTYVSTRSLYANQNDAALDVYHVVQTMARSLISSIYSTMGADDGGLNNIMLLFDMPATSNTSEVRAFLESDKSLLPLISEIYHKLQIYFPYNRIFMQVVQAELVISVGTTLPPKEAKDILYKFDEEWWLDIDVDLRSKLCITVEFQ